MNEMDEALRRLVVQVGAGTDVWIDGPPAAVRRLLTRAEPVLAEQATVVSVAAPVGELNLSSLIAQLSGRPDLDEQDDAVLELCSKRLTGEGHTVLLLVSPHGIGRSALRYLQHMSRQASRLVAVVLGSAPLAATLLEPGFEALRVRWQAAPAVALEAVARLVPEVVVPEAVMPVPAQSASPVPVAETMLPAHRPVRPTRKRPIVWAASALGAAGVAGFVWFAYGAPGVSGAAASASGIPLVTALVPMPPLTPVPVPSAVALSIPAAQGASSPPPIQPSLPQHAAVVPPPTALTTPPPVANLRADAVASSAAPVARAEQLPALRRAEPSRREPTRLARARPYWPPPHYQEPAQYEPAQPYYDAPPAWIRRAARPPEPSYLGTYAADPYGVRVFRYDP